MLRGLLWVLGAQVIGEAASAVLPGALPGSVLGMLLLAAGLRAGLVPRGEVRPVAAILTRYMGLFLVPAAVGVAGLLDRLTGRWGPVLLASLTSSLIVLVVVGLGAARRGEAA